MEPEKKDVRVKPQNEELAQKWFDFCKFGGMHATEEAQVMWQEIEKHFSINFISKAEWREKVQAKQSLFNFIPQDEYGYKRVKTSDLDLLDLLTQEK